MNARYKPLREGQRLICIKERLGNVIGKYYEVSSIKGDFVSVKNDYGIHNNYMNVINEDDVNIVIVSIWDEFDTLKDVRKRKLKKIYENTNNT